MTTTKAAGLHFGATRVPADNSIAAIEKLLTKYRAMSIDKDLDPATGRCLAIRAQLVVGTTVVPIKLDNRADKILARMKADHAARRDAAKKARRSGPAPWDEAAARVTADRVGWRTLRAKLESDIAMLEAGFYEGPAEALFTHVVDGQGVTVFERFKELGAARFLALPPSTEG